MFQLDPTNPINTLLIGASVALLCVWVAVELKFEGTIRNAVRIISAFLLAALFMLLATASGMIVW